MADVNTNINQQENQQESSQQENQQVNKQENKTPTIEELTAQLADERAARASERAESTKNKAALDKALKEIGDLKKERRQLLTADEQEKEAKREQEEQQKQYIAGLEEFQKRTLAEKRYILQGMTAELAAKAAEAEISGDMDELASVHKQHTETLLKEARAEWLKSRPQINAGVGSGATMTREEIMAIKDPAQRRRMIAENITLFD